MRRWRQRALIGALLAAGVWLLAEAAVTFFAQETLTRWKAPVPSTLTHAPYLPGNPYLLWEMVPGERSELDVSVSVNSLGLRGPEIEQPKPSGIRRVVVLGDSSVYGHGVPDEATFAQLLDHKLGPNVQVINGGVPGYSTEQTLNLMALRIWDLEPDLLVIGSLWSDNNFDSFVDRELISRHQAFEGHWLQPAVATAELSAVYRFADWHLRIARREAQVREVGWMLGRAPQGDARRVPVNDYAANLQLMVDQATARGAQVIFLGLANEVDLGVPTSGAQAWTLYREVMEEAAFRNQAQLVDVASLFEQSQLGASTLFLDEMHPTAAGHALIADALELSLSDWVLGGAISEASPDPVPHYEDRFSRGSLTAGSASAGQAEITGSILTSSPTPLQIDALSLAPGSNEPVQIAGERLDGPGVFSLSVPVGLPIILRIYRDSEGDGPGPGDPLITLETLAPLEVGETRVHIDLDRASLERR
jgi:lysophospholipase L1-like esterase